MKVLSVTIEEENRRPLRYTIWVSEASILSKYNEAGSVVLAVDNEVHDPEANYLRRRSDDRSVSTLAIFERCAGVIEATDQEMEILADAGYHLTDLRNARPSELIKALSG